MGLGSKIAAGAGWMVGLKLIERALGLVSTIVLARLLAPGDFGLVAMATAVIAIIELLGALGLDVALIQNQSADRRHYDTAWTLNLLFALGCALVVSALALPAAGFYDEPRLAPVMYCLAASMALGGLENIGIVNFRKNLEFRKEFVYLFAKKLVGVVTAISVAVAFGSYWALVAGIVTARAVSVLLSYALHPFRPRFSLAAVRELVHFGGWLLVNNVLLTLSQRLSDFVVGKVGGTTALGVFSVGYELATLPSTELVAPINRAVLPGYSRLNDDTTSLRDGFVRVFGVIALIVIPAGTGIAAVAESLVLTILGPKWREAIPLLGILPFFGVLWGLQTNVVMVALAVGKPRVVTAILVLFLMILIPCVVAGLDTFGIRGLAWAHVFAAGIVLPVTFAAVCRMLALEWPKLAKNLWRPLIAASVMYAIVSAFAASGSNGGVPGLVLLAGVFMGIVLYSATITALWFASGRPEGAETYVLARLRAALSQILTR